MQIPQDPLSSQKLTINSIKANSEPNHNLRYYPNWTASEVAGRPKKNKRKQSVLEKATGKKGQKKASGVKRARRYCQSCGAHSHVTNDCWNLPSNTLKRPAHFAVLDVEESHGNDDIDDEQPVGEELEELGQTGTAD